MVDKNVLLITNDVVGERMAGPGIRVWELSRVLSKHFRVTLAVPPFLEVRGVSREPDFPVRIRICQRTEELHALVAETDIIITLGAVVLVYPFLTRTGKPLVVDSYDPFMLAALHWFHGLEPEKRSSAHEKYRRAHLLALRSADFILCASEKQRDYWLGMLSAIGRVNPQTHDDDPSLTRLIQVVPFGMPSEVPQRARSVLKGVYPGIEKNDKVVLWGGGIWDWLDAPTAVRAMGVIAQSRRDVKLLFMGTVRPNPLVARMRAVDETVDLARRLGLLERCVLFNDWVPYEARQDYLLEADVGISLNRELLETRFAFRTRLLDYIWARLPIVATEGDVLSEQVGLRGLGKLVKPGDERGVAKAILELVDTPERKATLEPHFSSLAVAYRWDVVAEPLVDFCRNPRLAPDKKYLESLPAVSPPRRWKLAIVRALTALKEGRFGRGLYRFYRRMSRR